MPDPNNPATTAAAPGGHAGDVAPGGTASPGSESTASATPSAADLRLAELEAQLAERDERIGKVEAKNREILEEKRRKAKEAADEAAARGETQKLVDFHQQQVADLTSEIEALRPVTQKVTDLEARIASQDKVIEDLVKTQMSTLTDAQHKALETLYPDWKQAGPMERLDRINRYTAAHGIAPGRPGPRGDGRLQPGRPAISMANPERGLAAALRG